MQLLLSLADEPSSEPEQPHPKVWPTLSIEQRKETIALLARVLARAAAADAATRSSTKTRKGSCDE